MVVSYRLGLNHETLPVQTGCSVTRRRIPAFSPAQNCSLEEILMSLGCILGVSGGYLGLEIFGEFLRVNSGVPEAHFERP